MGLGGGVAGLRVLGVVLELLRGFRGGSERVVGVGS